MKPARKMLIIMQVKLQTYSPQPQTPVLKQNILTVVRKVTNLGMA